MKLPISKIKPNPNNPRLIKDDKFKKLVQSLKDFPIMAKKLRKVVVDEDGVILGGNMRFKAIKEAGMKEVHVEYFTREDAEENNRLAKELDPEHADKTYEEQCREFVVKDNVSGGEWDWDILANEWDAEELDEWGLDTPDTWGEDKEVEEYEAPEVDDSEPPKSKLGEVYQLGRHRVMCGDSTDKANVELLMNGEKADMVFTDPPYNLASEGMNAAANSKSGKAYNVLKASQWDHNFEVRPFLDVMNNFLSPDVTVMVCTSHFLFGDIVSWMDEHLDYDNYCVWVKTNPMPSLSKRRFTWATELLVYGTRGKQTFNFPDEGHALNWLQSTSPSHETAHPTEKPANVPAHYIKLTTKKNDSVLDLFAGSGTTLIACEQTDRTCYGMELDPKYVDVIRKRYHKFVTGNEEGWEDGTPAV